MFHHRVEQFVLGAFLRIESQLGGDRFLPAQDVTHFAAHALHQALEFGARRRRFLPVVVDGSALAPVARECATIMRGDWRTAALVHTPRDTAARLTLEGVGSVAMAVGDVLGSAPSVDGAWSQV